MFAQICYLYILLEATLAYVIIPMAIVRNPSTVAISNGIVRKPAEHQQMQVSASFTDHLYQSVMAYKVPCKQTEWEVGNSPQGLIDKNNILIQPCIIRIIKSHVCEQ